MNHATVLRTLNKLSPDIREKGAEPVLLKHAQANDLSPAQLERMAQMWNNIRTVNFMDKSANARGDSFSLIDVPALLEKYSEYEAPAAKRDNSWDSWLGKTKRASTVVPHFIDQWTGKPSLVKAAAAPEKDHLKPALEINQYILHKSALQETQYELDELAVYREQLHDEAIQGLRKLASHIREHGPVRFEHLEEDAILHLGAEPSKRAFDQLEALCRNDGPGVIEVKRATAGNDKRMVYSDRYNKMAEVRGIAQTLQWLDNCRPVEREIREKLAALRAARTALLAAAFSSGFGAEPLRGTDGSSFPNDFKPQTAAVSSGFGVGAKPSRGTDGSSFPNDYKFQTPAAVSSGFGVGAEPSRGTDGSSFPDDSQFQNPAGRHGTPTPTSWSPGTPSKTYGGGGTPSKTDGGGGKSDLKADLLGHIRDMGAFGKSTLGSIGTAAGAASGNTDGNSLLDLIGATGTGANTAQRAVDRASQEVRAATNLERLMSSDPIISEADPQTVVSLFNTLRSTNPNMAQDMHAIKFALREAIQYSGVPTHTQSELAKLRVDQHKGMAALHLQNQLRYTTGA